MSKNQKVADFLDSLELSKRARSITDINMMTECFGCLKTAEEVEQEIRENYPDDEE